ncbi:hypothetical protein [Falsibacillus pallidus]|uniref:Lipoprotein n=1 Tax=Falsibacillus pallidus TaxID=493781 RepID=A0A370GNQ0_9BACI|nr:hypothetical protein [Falsibacillus pallidus]RDI44064.1 hypothetical protein DFR59_103127 [Falsibacillus pallidus]
MKKIYVLIIMTVLLCGCSIINKDQYVQYEIKNLSDRKTTYNKDVFIYTEFLSTEHFIDSKDSTYNKDTYIRRDPYRYAITIHGEFEVVVNVTSTVYIDNEIVNELKFDKIKRSESSIFSLGIFELDKDPEKIKEIKIVTKFIGIKNGKEEPYEIEEFFEVEKTIKKGNRFLDRLNSV